MRIFLLLGFSTPLGHFIYRAEFDDGLIEHELDHLFFGTTDLVNPAFNQTEIAELKWVDVAELKRELEQHSKHYTPWLKPALNAEATLKLPCNRLCGCFGRTLISISWFNKLRNCLIVAILD
jgi:isopentenyldiphosphate isomerase